MFLKIQISGFQFFIKAKEKLYSFPRYSLSKSACFHDKLNKNSKTVGKIPSQMLSQTYMLNC